MATIKSYTDIEQSRKLTEILPLESADMMWEQHYNNEPYVTVKPHTTIGKSISCHCCNYWSLAALLSVLTKNKICHYDDRYYCQYISEGDEFPIYSTAEYDNPVDACVAMIEKLHDLKML